MTAAKEILKIIPTLQAAQILNENIKESKKKKPKFVKTGVKSIIGIEMTKLSSDIIGGFE
jgi:hypothetical protein